MASSANTSRAPLSLEAKYSCLVCHKRKVKCDRGRPCSNCTKNNVDCEYRAPPAPRRRKRTAIDPALADKLRRYEDQLRRSGVKLDDSGDIIDDEDEGPDEDERKPERKASSQPPKSRTSSRTPLKAEEGTLLMDAGKSRYLESGLWVTLNDQLPNSNPLLNDQPENATEDDSSQSNGNSQPISILFGKARVGDPLEAFPKPEHVMIFWREFTTNVDPIVKMIHVPTVDRIVQLSCQHVHSLSRNNISLLFAIFLAAVSSMTDESCRAKFGQSKSSLYRKYVCASEKSFVRGGLLRTTDLTMLIAFITYIFAIRQLGDPQVIWILAGVAFRIAQRIGLHRNRNFTSMKPFDLEIRRRVWRQLLILDWASAELVGASSIALSQPSLWQADECPRNLNDSDLHPSMAELPEDRVGATDMMFAMLRCEFANFFSYKEAGKGQEQERTLTEEDNFVDHLERQIEQKFLRYCDPINPLHVMVTVVSRAALTSMRIRLQHPSRFADHGKNLTEKEHSRLFSLCVKALQYDKLVLTTPALQRFHWHTRDFFQYHPVIYLLIVIRQRRIGDEVDEAWTLLESSYQNRPELLRRRKGLHIALGMLALQAWDAREAELKRLKLPFRVPQFIVQLRSASPGDDRAPVAQPGAPRSAANEASRAPANQQHAPGNFIPQLPGLVGNWNQASDAAPQEYNQEQLGFDGNVNWNQWEQLIMNPEMPYNNEFGFNVLDGYFMPMDFR
jgi:hypothetical protein